MRPIDRFLELPERERKKLIEKDDYIRRAVVEGPQKHATFFMHDFMQPPAWEDAWRIFLLHACRGAGKDLDDDTPIPTPDGWKRNGDLRVGDRVFDEEGRPCNVTGVFPQGVKPVREVRFSDGSSIVAGEEHLWVTLTHDERSRRKRFGLGLLGWQSTEVAPRTHDGWQSFAPNNHPRKPITTKEIADTLTYGGRGDRNHCVPLALPLECEFKLLPIDPYVLGLWLGDGSSRATEVYCAPEDETHYAERVRGVGEHWRVVSRDPRTGVLKCSMAGTHSGRERMLARLRELGLYRNKHVPEEYLRSSVVQRLQLLRGLMDSDGSVDSRKSVCEFISTNECLASAVLELARSLGYKPTLKEGRATLYGRDVSAKYRVTWRARADMNPFSLPRKASLVMPLGGQAGRHRHRMIVSADPVGDRSTTCISVDSPHHLYLAGEAMIPTHNTLLMSWIVDKAVHEWGVRRLMFVGRDHGTVTDTNVLGDDGILACSRTKATYSIQQHGRPQVRWGNGAICRIGHPESPTTIRGGSYELVLGDEVAFWPNFGMRTTDDPLTMIRPTLRKGKARLILATTPNVAVPTVNRELLRIKNLRGTITRTCSLDQLTHMPEQVKQDQRDEFGWNEEEGYLTFEGRQELGGEIIIDPGTVVWTEQMVADALIKEEQIPTAEAFECIAISIDPSRKTKQASDPTGLVVLGRVSDPLVLKVHGFDPEKPIVIVLEALEGRWTPEDLAKEIKLVMRRWEGCPHIFGVVESNTTGSHFAPSMREFGVDIHWVEILADAATGDKRLRALDAVAWYQQGRVKHRPGLRNLERQQVLFTGVAQTQIGHDDLIDALSHGVPRVARALAKFMTAEDFARSVGVLPQSDLNPPKRRRRRSRGNRGRSKKKESVSA